MQLGAGAIYLGLDVSSLNATSTYEDVQTLLRAAADKKLGATRGGATFNATPTISIMDIDDMKFPIPGASKLDAWAITLASTALEITTKNIEWLLPTSFRNPITGAFGVRNIILPQHYMDNVVWAGKKGDGGYQVINLTTVLNVDGLAQTMASQGEGTIPFTFTAHQAEDSDTDVGPFQMWIFMADGMQSDSIVGASAGSIITPEQATQMKAAQANLEKAQSEIRTLGLEISAAQAAQAATVAREALVYENTAPATTRRGSYPKTDTE